MRSTTIITLFIFTGMHVGAAAITVPAASPFARRLSFINAYLIFSLSPGYCVPLYGDYSTSVGLLEWEYTLNALLQFMIDEDFLAVANFSFPVAVMMISTTDGAGHHNRHDFNFDCRN